MSTFDDMPWWVKWAFAGGAGLVTTFASAVLGLDWQQVGFWIGVAFIIGSVCGVVWHYAAEHVVPLVKRLRMGMTWPIYGMIAGGVIFFVCIVVWAINNAATNAEMRDALKQSSATNSEIRDALIQSTKTSADIRDWLAQNGSSNAEILAITKEISAQLQKPAVSEAPSYAEIERAVSQWLSDAGHAVQKPQFTEKGDFYLFSETPGGARDGVRINIASDKEQSVLQVGAAFKPDPGFARKFSKISASDRNKFIDRLSLELLRAGVGFKNDFPTGVFIWREMPIGELTQPNLRKKIFEIQTIAKAAIQFTIIELASYDEAYSEEKKAD